MQDSSLMMGQPIASDVIPRLCGGNRYSIINCRAGSNSPERTKMSPALNVISKNRQRARLSCTINRYLSSANHVIRGKASNEVSCNIAPGSSGNLGTERDRAGISARGDKIQVRRVPFCRFLEDANRFRI